MKKIASIVLCLIFGAAILCGCSIKTEELTVYVINTEALYVSAVASFAEQNPDIKLNVVSFESYDDVSERLNTELMSGKGPDVLLFNSLYDTVDPYKLTDSHMLMSLDEQVETLDREKYYSAILDTGMMNGHQYYIPFSWNILQAYSTVETSEQKKYDDLYSAFQAEAELLLNEENYAISSIQFRRSDVMNLFMEIAGTDLIDIESGTIAAQKETVKDVADFVKVFFDNMDKIVDISNKYRNDFAGAVSHYTYLVENYPFMNNLRYYQSVYPKSVNSEMFFAAFPQTDSEEITAQVIQYGAINGNTKNVENSWKLLQYIMDSSVNMNYSKYEMKDIYYAPVNKDVYSEAVSQLASEYGPGPKQKVEPLNEVNEQLLEEIAAQVTKGIIPNGVLGNMIQECMEPYLLGEDTFDNCYNKLIQRVGLYLSE